MITQDATPAPCHLTAASVPGGFFRHYRVQRLDQKGATWQVHATYTRRDEAQACLAALVRTGQQARLVDYNVCPVAL